MHRTEKGREIDTEAEKVPAAVPERWRREVPRREEVRMLQETGRNI